MSVPATAGRRRSRHASILVAFASCAALTLGACGGGSPSSTSTSMTTANSTTTVPTPPAAPVNPPLSSTGASGKGCTPAQPTLPDGLWVGRLTTVDVTAGTITLRLVCYYSNDGARAAGVVEPDYPLNDVVVDTRLPPFVVPTWPNVVVVPVEVVDGVPTGLPGRPRTGVASASAILTNPVGPVVWVQVIDGRAILIQQIFRLGPG